MHVGLANASTGFGVILAIVGRKASPAHRSISLGIVTAMGSARQIIGPPFTEVLLSVLSCQAVFLIFAGAIMASLLALPLLRLPPMVDKAELDSTMREILGKAFRDPPFTLIFAGFFSCGYQLGFVAAHFPAFVTTLSRQIGSFPGIWLDV